MLPVNVIQLTVSTSSLISDHLVIEPICREPAPFVKASQAATLGGGVYSRLFRFLSAPDPSISLTRVRMAQAPLSQIRFPPG